MFKIKRLYTEPALIDPVSFEDGINLILGETNETSDKTNSVGKSLCIEFISFALLKRKSESRLALIPKEAFPPDTDVCLDFYIDGIAYTIKRSLSEAERPTLIEGQNKTKFAKLEDAALFLTEKMFKDFYDFHPSFRQILGPLVREETSEFKSLINCYDTGKRISEDYAPHLYLLGIDSSLYVDIKEKIKEIEVVDKDMKTIESNMHLLHQTDISSARSEVNELNKEINLISANIDALENIAGYEVVRDDLIDLETRIEENRRRKAIIKQSLSRLRPISEKIDITADEISDFYNHLKQGLGTLLGKSLQEVHQFKDKINEFQNYLLDERKEALNTEVEGIDQVLTTLDKLYSEKIGILDQKGNLKNLKQTYAAFQKKTEEAAQLNSFINRYQELETKRQGIKTKKEAELLKLQSNIAEAKPELDDFENTILDIHDFIQGNRKASFKLKQTSKKQVVEIDMRIFDDGGHSVEREKVFIYDLALLLNKKTAQRHPGLLIHDNIFNVDRDTLVKSLKFLDQKAKLYKGQQYILTLNVDSLASNDDGKKFLSSLNAYVRGTFTKSKRFLKTQYQEKR